MFSLAAQSSSGTSWVILIVVYAVIFGGFYMIFMRPQKKEQKRLQAMLNDMEVGDSIVTTSGFYQRDGSWRYSTDNEWILRCAY